MISFKKQMFLLLLFGLASKLPAAITVDTSVEKQEFLGFGAQIWLGQEKLEPSFAELGIRWARLSLPGMRECPLTEGSIDDFAAYFRSKIITGEFRSTYEMLKRNRVTLVLNAFSVPIAWQDQEKQLPVERLDLFARMWAGAVKCLVENGMPPQWLELFNEPDGTWSGRCWPDKYNRVVQRVRAELDRLGYESIQICGPGLAHVDLQGPDKWIEGLDTKGVDAIGAWSLHGYEWRRRESAAVLREELKNGFLASAKKKDPRGKKPLFITEYGSFNTVYHGAEYLSPREAYVQKTAAQIPAWNVRVIENGLSFLNEGINTLIYWQLADISWEETNFGIYTRIKDGGKPQMIDSALRGLFPEIAEGFHVVETEQEPDSDLYAAALSNGRRLVCCIINRSAEARNTTVVLKNQPDIRLIKRNVFSNGRLCSVPLDEAAGKPLSVTIPGDGYVTLVLEQILLQTDSVVTVHPDQQLQKVVGFGGCAWTGDPGALAVMQELGMSWVRFNMEGIPGFNQPDLPVDQYVNYFEQQTEWDRVKYMWAMKKASGLTFMLVSFGAPPCWMDDKKVLKAEHLDAFSRLWAAGVKAYADKGFVPEYIELFNEPDGHWNAYCSPENYNTVVKAVRRYLDQAGLQKVKIAGPGRAHIDYGNSDQWIDALDSQAMQSLSAFSVHGWTFDGPKSHSSQYVRDSATGFFNSVNTKDPQQKKLRIMTEFSTKDTVFNEISLGNHANQYRGTAADSHLFAVHVTGDLLLNLNAGFNVVLFWQMSDQWWENAGWGLMGRMEDGYSRKPVFQALETVLPEIGNSRVVAIDQSKRDVYSAAFVQGSRLTVVTANSSFEKSVQSVRLAEVEHAVLFQLRRFSQAENSCIYPRQNIQQEWTAEFPPESVTVATFDLSR